MRMCVYVHFYVYGNLNLYGPRPSGEGVSGSVKANIRVTQGDFRNFVCVNI
jgi:hypothetical protein